MAIGKSIWRSKPRGRRHKGKATGADVDLVGLGRVHAG